jgi:hypothetical protein
MSEYIGTIKRIYYKLDNPRKFNQASFLKEIRGALLYSRLEFTQNLLIELRDGKLTKDELHGELQIALKKSYEEYKKEFGLLRLPNMNFDEFFLGDK